MDYIKVKDKNYLVRDTDSNGIVNTDFDSYENYVFTYKNRMSSEKKLKEFEEDMNHLKNDIEEIKTLLKDLLK